MSKKEKTSNAVAILHNRYVKDEPERQASLAAERVNAEVAQMIFDLRKRAGLSQKDLAERVGTTQSVISRLEDADYEGHSLSMLHRIADALEQKLVVEMTAKTGVGSVVMSRRSAARTPRPDLAAIQEQSNTFGQR